MINDRLWRQEELQWCLTESVFKFALELNES